MPFKAFGDIIYAPLSDMINSGEILSVDEVYRELNRRWNDKSPEGKWLKAHKSCFQNITNEEGFVVAEIFKNKKFQEGVKEKSIREGNPEADAFIVAKAKIVGGIVVTAESDNKDHSEKIPNIASSLGVPYMKIDDFYTVLTNVSQGKPNFEGVEVYSSLKNPVPLSSL
jgi:hypothetical protein